MDKISQENMVTKDSPIINPLFLNKIKIGKANIFESGVEIETAGGEIEIGNYNVFENHVRITNTSPTDKMSIGSYNYFEPKVIINTTHVNNFNILKTYSMVSFSQIKDYCVIGMNSSIIVPGTTLDCQIYSDNLGVIDHVMAKNIPSGYQNSINQTYKKVAETKIKSRLKSKELDQRRQQAATAAKPGATPTAAGGAAQPQSSTPKPAA